jgi:hypothetical protein
MKPVDSAQRLDMLERTVLELGTEVYALKSTLAKSQASHEQFLGILKGLKQLLDAKGLITLDDFDAAVELGEALEAFNAQQNLSTFEEADRSKKSSH